MGLQCFTAMCWHPAACMYQNRPYCRGCGQLSHATDMMPGLPPSPATPDQIRRWWARWDTDHA